PVYAVKNISALEKSAEHLVVETVHPFAAKFDRMLAFYDRKVVAELRTPKGFIDRRGKEERVAETERWPKAHCGVGRNVRRSCPARAILTRIGKVGFVEHRGRDRGKEVEIQDIYLRRTLSAGCGGAVGWNVKCLIIVFGVVEVVGYGELIALVDIPIDLAKQCSVINLKRYRQPFIRIAGSLHEVDERNTLAIRA